MSEIINPTFERWLKYIFDHPVTNPAWYFGIDAEFYDPDEDPAQAVDYIGRLFALPAKHTKPYTDAQIAQGFYHLIHESEPDIYTLFNPDVPLETRIQTTKDMYNIFAEVFAPRCSDKLSHLFRTQEQVASANPMNSVCYMWWDIIGFYGKSGDAHREVLDTYCLDVMEKTLALDSLACQESALHGLGHWQNKYKKRVQKIIDTYLKREKKIDEPLKQYALSARAGCVL